MENYKVDLSLEELYFEFERDHSIQKVVERLSKNVELLTSYGRQNVMLDNIFPIVKLEGTVDEELYNLKGEILFLDLKFYFVEDKSELIEFLPNEVLDKIFDVKNIAIGNLLKRMPEMVTIDSKKRIYCYCGIDFAAALLLVDDVVDTIVKILGKTFLIITPSPDMMVFCPDSNQNMEILYKIIELDPLKRVSEKIYRYNDRVYSYADISNVIRVLE